MKIYSVNHPEFKPYGQVLAGYDTWGLLEFVAALPAGIGGLPHF